MEGFDQLQQAQAAKASQVLEQQRYDENQVMALQTQQVIVQSFSSLVDYLDNKVTKTEVINQLQAIGTPDVFKVVDAVNSLHSTISTHENTDLTEITAVMRAVLNEVSALPKEIPKTEIPEPIDNTKQFNALVDAVKSLEKVVKAQETTVEAPVVNVPAPKVDVEAPDLSPLQTDIKAVTDAVKAIVIPEYKTDNAEVEKLLKKLNKLFNEFLDSTPAGGGGGASIPAYRDSTGNVSQVVLTAEGAVPTRDLPLAVQIDDATTVNAVYIGKANIGSSTSSAVWQIAKLDTTSGLVKKWADGDANFNNIFDNRASLTYQ